MKRIFEYSPFAEAVYVLTGLLVTVLAVAGDVNQAISDVDDNVLELSLEDLLAVEVTSVARKPQKLSESAAAIHVITERDIRRSGVTSIPEALRLAPGVQVGRIDSNKWAISIRGQSGRFSNKLLVLIDGCSVYAPTFSGVYWNAQDMMLEDIERIEVIRGPGATIWGANAVNGVINVITKAAADTQGTLFTVGAGTEERGFSAIRHGGKLGENRYYRVYAKHFQRDGSKRLDNGRDSADDWQSSRIGFRLDWDVNSHDTVTVQGAAYKSDGGETVRAFSADNPALNVVNQEMDWHGGYFQLNWSKALAGSDHLAVQFSYDHSDREQSFTDRQDNLDFNFQHRISIADWNDLQWGIGFHQTWDVLPANETIRVMPAQRSYNVVSGVIQDDIALVPDKWVLTLGSKFEYNAFSGFEIQPNMRLLWMIDSSQSTWLSVARAVRTPGRGEHDVEVRGLQGGVHALPGRSAPVAITLRGDRSFDSEVSIAYEWGYRIQLNHQLGFDLAAFYFDFDRLRAGEDQAERVCRSTDRQVIEGQACLSTLGPVYLEAPVVITNAVEADYYGFDMTLDWRLRPDWRMQLNYAFLEAHARADQAAQGSELMYAGTAPQHQLSLRSALDLPFNTKLDLWWRYSDSIQAYSVPDYTTLDARFAWVPMKGLELSLVGQNLLDGRHPEFVSELGDVIATEVERSVYAQLRWSF